MTPAQEVRLIVYAVTLLLLLGGAGYGGWHLGTGHIQAQWDIDTKARDLALSDQKTLVIAAQAARLEAEQRAQVDHAKQVADNARTVGGLLDSLHGLEAALHLGALPSAVGNPGQPGGAGAGAGGDAVLAGLVERVNRGVKETGDACLHDSAELTAILALAPPPGPRP